MGHKSKDNITNYSSQQLLDGTRLYMVYFDKVKGIKSYQGKRINISADNGLIAFRIPKGGFLFFGRKYDYLVYRLADVETMEHISTDDGKKQHVIIKFHDVPDGNVVRIEGIYKDKFDSIKKAIYKAMGLTGLKGLKTAFDKNLSFGKSSDEKFYLGREESMRKADAAIKKLLG